MGLSKAELLLRGIDARSVRATWLVWQRRTAQADRLQRAAAALIARAAKEPALP